MKAKFLLNFFWTLFQKLIVMFVIRIYMKLYIPLLEKIAECLKIYGDNFSGKHKAWNVFVIQPTSFCHEEQKKDLKAPEKWNSWKM